MGELIYEDMIPAQATEALEEFVTERTLALEQLRSSMAAHGLDPEALLEGTPESVRPVWEWITTQANALGINPWSPDKDPTRPSWPS